LEYSSDLEAREVFSAGLETPALRQAWMTALKLEILCLPLLAAWFIYYLMCLFWFARLPVTPV
jgi:hypothetical protein